MPAQTKRRAGRPTEPIGVRVYQSVKSLIVTHAFDDQRRFPTEHELCERFSVSRGTIRTALQKIEKEGLLIRRAGDGAYLAPKGLSGLREMHDAAEDLSVASIWARGKLPLRLGSFEYPDANKELWKTLFNDFCARHTDLIVKAEKVDAFGMASLKSSAGMPDVLNVCTADLKILASRGLLLDLSSFENEFCRTGSVPGALDECKVDGRLHAIPQELGLSVMYANAELLDRLRIDIRDAAWTWGEVLDILQTAVAPLGNRIWGINFPAAYTYLTAFGVFRGDRPFFSSEYTRNAASTVALLDWLLAARQTPNVLFDPLAPHGESLKKFVAGDMLFYFHGTFLNSHLQKFCHFPVKALQPPLGVGAVPGKMLVAWAISADTTLPLRSVEWLKFMTEDQGPAAVGAKGGNIPGRLLPGFASLFPSPVLTSQLSSGVFHRLPSTMQRILEYEVWRPSLDQLFSGTKNAPETLAELQTRHARVESVYQGNMAMFGG